MGVLGNIQEDIDHTIEAAGKLKEILSQDIVKKFLKNPMGFILTAFFDGWRMLIVDNIQSFANILTFSDVKLDYDYSELKESDNSEINKYVNVGKYDKTKAYSKDTTNALPRKINIAKDTIHTDEEDRKFSETTKITYIAMDLFNVATNKIESFDINFIAVNNNIHQEDSTWMYFRSIYTIILRMEIFLCSMYLVAILIFNGIKFVKSGISNPDEHLESRNVIERFGKSLLMLVGTVVIISLTVYLSDLLADKIKVQSSNEFPIRVYVEEANYTFSTNITGYYRYMSCIEGINNYADKGLYTFLYTGLAVMNFAVAFFMFLRLFVMMMLSAAGPIIAVKYSKGNENGMKYSAWVTAVFGLAVSKIIVILVYNLIERFTI